MSCYTKEIILICVLCFENTVLKMSRPIFLLMLHLFYYLPSVVLTLFIFGTECSDEKNLTSRNPVSPFTTMLVDFDNLARDYLIFAYMSVSVRRHFALSIGFWKFPSRL